VGGEDVTPYPHANSLRYNARMETPPVILAARNRAPRRRPRAITGGEGGARQRRNNFIAEGPKKQAGAPLGNHNAARRDPESLDSQAPLAHLEALVQQLKARADAAMAVIATVRRG
jgi:hypothetical protein